MTLRPHLVEVLRTSTSVVTRYFGDLGNIWFGGPLPLSSLLTFSSLHPLLSPSFLPLFAFYRGPENF